PVVGLWIPANRPHCDFDLLERLKHCRVILPSDEGWLALRGYERVQQRARESCLASISRHVFAIAESLSPPREDEPTIVVVGRRDHETFGHEPRPTFGSRILNTFVRFARVAVQ